MAFKFPTIFANMDAKTRVFFIFAIAAAVSLVIYLGVRFLGGKPATTGPSKVATAPGNLQSVPGGQLSPEYYRALMQANVQASQQGQITGGSAVPTLINASQGAFGSCITCPSEDTPNVVNDINDLVKSGKLSQNDANKLLDLANKNASVDEYENALNELVKQGKLSPEEARKLLEHYRKQHQNGLITDSGKTMDALIKSGQLPLNVANQLLALQKANVTPAEYAAELDRLVREGKISPQVAAQLLAQYAQQRSQEMAKSSAAAIRQMAQSGQLSSDVAESLIAAQAKNPSIDDYAKQLNALVAAGKMTPETAKKLLDMYKKQRLGLGASSINDIIAKQRAQCRSEINGFVADKKISKELGDALIAMQDKDVSLDAYQTAVAQAVQDKKIPANVQAGLITCYQKLTDLINEMQRLAGLQNSNASLTDYANELKKAVQAGLISPEMAAQLMQEYQAAQAASGPVLTGVGVEANIPGAEDFAKLQARLQGEVQQPTPQQFTTTDNQAALDQQRLARIQTLESAMSSQAQTLITAWAPPTMAHVGGSAATTGKDKKLTDGVEGLLPKGSKGATGSATEAAAAAVLIKAGTIYFAVLDTGVDSDYPDTPAMATIVEGPYKGAKLMGKINVVKDKDRLSVTFSVMNTDDWPTSKTINAFAIDPDTARTVMASSVDNHYLKRYGAIFAASFVSGYGSAISTAGSTQTTGIFGSTTTNSTFSPAGKLAIALGKVGDNLTTAAQSYVNTPVTVKINSGVGIGVLFMNDVTQ